MIQIDRDQKIRILEKCVTIERRIGSGLPLVVLACPLIVSGRPGLEILGGISFFSGLASPIASKLAEEKIEALKAGQIQDQQKSRRGRPPSSPFPEREPKFRRP